MGWPTKYTGDAMDSTLEKGRQIKSSNNGWIKMTSSVSNPVNLRNLKNTGNYTMDYISDGPANIDSTIKPINVTVSDIGGKLYQFISVGEITYNREITEDGRSTRWVIEQSNGSMKASSTAPANPIDGKSLWLDISNPNLPLLKFYINGEWVEIRSENIMKKSVYDPQNKNTDIYAYIENALKNGDLDGGISDMTEYTKHITDENIHMTADDITDLKTMPTTETLAERTQEIKNSIKSNIETSIGTDKSKYTNITEKYNSAKSELGSHIADTTIHPSEAKKTSWNNKAAGNHGHNNDHSVKVRYSDIDGGIPANVLPYFVKERAYKIENENALKSITKNPYHNGDMFYIENSVGSSNTWYLLKDDSKLGSLDAFVKVESSNVSGLSVVNAVGKPTTINGYGITDAVKIADATKEVNGIIKTAKGYLGNATVESIGKVGYNYQVYNFAMAELNNIENILTTMDSVNSNIKSFLSY